MRINITQLLYCIIYLVNPCTLAMESKRILGSTTLGVPNVVVESKLATMSESRQMGKIGASSGGSDLMDCEVGVDSGVVSSSALVMAIDLVIDSDLLSAVGGISDESYDLDVDYSLMFIV